MAIGIHIPQLYRLDGVAIHVGHYANNIDVLAIGIHIFHNFIDWMNWLYSYNSKKNYVLENNQG